MKIIIFIAVVLALFFWCTQFLKLMRMKSADFQSKEDKTLWVITLLLLNTFGALLFWIYSKPEREVIPQLGIDLYSEIKETYPNYQKEIDLALKMHPYKRYDLEKWYGRKSTDALITEFKRGSDNIDPGCFGVLLAVLSSKNIEP